MARGPRSQKPPPGTLLDPSNGFSDRLGACFPFWEGAGAPVELLSEKKVALSGTTSWGSAAHPFMGSCFSGDGSSGYGTINLPRIDNWKNLSVSMLWRCPGTAVTSARIVEKGANTEWQVTCHTSGDQLVFIVVGDGGVDASGVTFDGKWHHLAFTWDGISGHVRAGTLRLYWDGVLVNTNVTNVDAGTGTLNLFRYGGGGFYSQSSLNGLWIWPNRVLTSAQMFDHAREPWQMFASPFSVMPWPLLSSPAPPSSATLGITEGADTLSAPAIFKAIGSLAVTNGDDSLSAAATAKAIGSASITEGADTLAAAVSFRTSAALGITEGADTLASATRAYVPAAFAANESGDTLAAAAGFTAPAALNRIEDGDTLEATVSISWAKGSLAITEDGDALTALARAYVPAALGITEGADTLAVAVRAYVPGGLASLEQGDTLVGAIHASVPASLAVTEGNDTLSGHPRAIPSPGTFVDPDMCTPLPVSFA